MTLSQLITVRGENANTVRAWLRSVGVEPVSIGGRTYERVFFKADLEINTVNSDD